MAEFAGQFIDDEYIFRFGTSCTQCGRELRTDYLLSPPCVAQVVTLGWGPICKRCAWSFWDTLDKKEYPHDDDEEVYA